MRKIFYLAFVALMCSCGGQTNGQKSADNAEGETAEATTLDSEEVIGDRFVDLYSEDDDRSLYSASFNELMDKVRKFDDGAELGYFDHDIRHQAQDDVRLQNFEVSDITATSCNVDVFTSDDRYMIKLVKENDVWVIDDVNNERERMTKYLAN